MYSLPDWSRMSSLQPVINAFDDNTSTSVYIQNNSASDVTLNTTFQPATLGSEALGVQATSATKGAKTRVSRHLNIICNSTLPNYIHETNNIII